MFYSPVNNSAMLSHLRNINKMDSSYESSALMH